MESMKSGSANHSHHPNKVAINSLETDSNKRTIASSVSGNTLNNNNKSSGNNQQEYQSTTESKDNNFEYDDNEWDVGGIGDLIKDLDNDIKKTSETDKLIAPSKSSTSERSRSSSSSPSSLSTPSSSSIVGNQNSPTDIEKTKEKSNIISTSINEKEEVKKQATATNSVTPTQANKQKYSAYIGQDKNQKQPNNLVTDSETIVTENNPKSIGNMSSNTTGQTTGKAGNKVSIDHQATLDKGLKMKIKRTKPGTKTSEAKHEIVKAEQNGSLSSGDDNVGKKSSLQQQNPQSSGGQPHQAQQLIPNQSQIDSSTNKRQGGSLPTSAKGTHRRDKARDKTSYPQRDKTNNNMNSNNSRNGNPNNINNSDTSNSSVSNSGDRTHNSHDISSAASITTSDSNSGQSTSLPSSTNMISTDSSAGSSGSSTNNAYSSNTSTSGPESITKNPNAPGPPHNDSIIPQSTQSTNNVSAQLKTTLPSTASISQSDPLNISISNQMSNLSNGDESSPPAKKMKCEPKDMVDVCVGTSVGTITEPDCLGPCEPGTSVTLEGIVWHETEGGVLVVNVTWRGKTYVGTLLDCTRHDWAPPRFCDSPTEELDSRTPKGRAKRGRSAAQQPANDLSNFTETRSSVHSKLRNASAKGRASRSSSGTAITAASTTVTNVTTSITNASTTTTTSTMSSNVSTPTPTPSISPTAPRAEKRKCGLSILGSESSPPPSLNGSDSNGSNSESATMSDLNVQIPSKKVKAPCAVSPVLLECPEQDCSKKYKHANGLRYHQSHAHGSGSMDEDTQLPESPPCESITTGLSTSALPSDSSHSFSSVQPIIQNQILNENSNMSAVSLTNQTSSISAQTPTKDSLTKGGSISMGETSPMQIQNDFSSVRHGNESSPSQSRVDNENSNTMDSSAASQIAGSSNIVQTPTKGDTQGKASAPIQVGQPVSMVKAQKKQRKEGSSEFDSTQRDRDDVQSPAYSDISDDSTPVVDSEQISASSTTSDHSNSKQSTNVPAPIANDFTKVKEPPLDLIAKPSTQPSDHVNNKQPAQLPSTISSDFSKVKESSLDLKFNYYPYNYMPGYPYNIDPNYGPVSMITEEGKMSTPQPMIKEERIKENPSPNDNAKSQLPIPLGKTIKTEPGKELKSHAPPVPLEGHSKDLTTSPISSYPGMFQRQSLNVPQPQPQPPPEELRRYYGMYPDQRRSSTSSNSSSANMPQNIKEGSQSPSPSQNQRDKERNDHSQPKNLKGPHGLAQSQKQTTKDTKISDEKESTKPKQDIGQKPTFESQGPPPPPTSQFYAIHPPYMGPGPFGFEPPMYRNMMVPYNSSPYHLQMSRFHAPEDLSRNTNSKALDLLQHHSAQYYNSHKIHELSERALKSPTGSQTKTSVSSPVSQAPNQQIQPPVSQQQSMAPTPNSINPNVLAGGHPNIQSSNTLQPPQTSIPLSATKNSSTTPTANMSGSSGDLSNKDGAPSERSPPPAMRHIHTHHHTHVGVGLGYPMYPAAYSAAVLAPQQAAVAVINPFPPGPNK